ncbi:MAG: Tad domain-containing protein [Deltaproteobacteria bacterium]|nr:Tad domain-containing protein [Deltaproteobacteria bacterium]
MKSYFKLFEQARNQAGVAAVIVAIVLSMLIGFTALAVDVGYMYVTKNELQNVADAAALAGAGYLGSIYEMKSYDEQQTHVFSRSDIVSVVQQVALKNQAAGTNIVINDADVTIGTWDCKTGTCILTATPAPIVGPDAVRVIARRDGSANGAILTFFARIFNINAVDVWADATAALTGQSTAGPGGLPLPVGISKKWFDKPEYCEQPIKFYPTGTLEGCAGWHTYKESPANANSLRRILEELTPPDRTYETPPVQAGETEFTFTGGTVASVFDEMQALFDAMKVLNDGILDVDEDSTTWTTSVPVYDRDDCSNPLGAITIVGFATVTITEVQGAPDKIIQAQVICEIKEIGRGGGSNYGTKGTIPGLVE